MKSTIDPTFLSDFLAFKQQVSPRLFVNKSKTNNSHLRVLRGPHDELIESRVYLGGMSGGSCYGGAAESFEASGERDEGPVALERLALEFIPNIRLSDFKDLVASIVHEDSVTERLYYGNTSEYRIYYFSLYSFWVHCQKLLLWENLCSN